jgi:hypothetical protein
MMSSRIYISKTELLEVIKILEENNVEGVVELIYDNESGIGSTLDVEFDFELNNRTVAVRANVVGVENW